MMRKYTFFLMSGKRLDVIAGSLKMGVSKAKVIARNNRDRLTGGYITDGQYAMKSVRV